MAVELVTEYGKVYVTDEVVAVLAGSAALDCSGMIGMSSRNPWMDGITEMFRKDHFRRGVEVHRDAKGNLSVDLYVVVSYGAKITEVARSVQTKVSYVLNEVTGLQVNNVNVNVQEVRIVAQ